MKQKILHIITLSEWGGAQRVCYDIATNLNKSQFLAEVACGGEGELKNKLKRQGITVHKINSLARKISFIKDVKALFLLYRLIRGGGYDVVHCHSTKAGLLGRIAARLAGVPKIYFTVHGWGFYNQEFGYLCKPLIFFEKVLAWFSDKIICVSENDKIQALAHNIASENKLVMILNGIEWQRQEKTNNLRKGIGADNSDIIFGMIGRLTHQKNPILFLKAARKVLQDYPRTKFVLIGGGPLFQECQNFIKENKLGQKIFLLGEKTPEDTRGLLLDFDVFVLTSRFEGLPITIIEAMFAGLPIIATDVGGVKELVEENGFLVKPNDVDDLVNKMVYFMKHPQKRKEMGERGYKTAKENFTLDKMIENYENLYKKISPDLVEES